MPVDKFAFNEADEEAGTPAGVAPNPDYEAKAPADMVDLSAWARWCAEPPLPFLRHSLGSLPPHFDAHGPPPRLAQVRRAAQDRPPD